MASQSKDISNNVDDDQNNIIDNNDNNTNDNTTTSMKKGRWSKKDDERLETYVKMEQGKPRWTTIATKFGSRSGKQCRERWENHLRNNIRKRRFSPEESKFIHDEVEKYRPDHPKWAAIAAKLDSHTTPLMVRNHVNNIRRKKHQNALKKRKDTKNKAANLSVKELRPKKSHEDDDDSSKTRMTISYLLN